MLKTVVHFKKKKKKVEICDSEKFLLPDLDSV